MQAVVGLDSERPTRKAEKNAHLAAKDHRLRVTEALLPPKRASVTGSRSLR